MLLSIKIGSRTCVITHSLSIVCMESSDHDEERKGNNGKQT
jgi:hypothetical protein